MFIKTCTYRYCLKDFETKISKQKYCCIRHKNQESYQMKNDDYQYEIILQKARLDNIKILERLLDREVYRISAIELTKMGFNFKAAIVPDINDKKQEVFRYGYIYLIAISTTEFKINIVTDK